MLYVGTWHGLWMPKGTPDDVFARVNAAARAAMNDPGVKQRIADLGMNLPPREIETPRLSPPSTSLRSRSGIR